MKSVLITATSLFRHSKSFLYSIRLNGKVPVMGVDGMTYIRIILKRNKKKE